MTKIFNTFSHDENLLPCNNPLPCCNLYQWRFYVSSQNGYTGLMFAIVSVHVSVVKELVLAKANVNLRNRVSSLVEPHHTTPASQQVYVQVV